MGFLYQGYNCLTDNVLGRYTKLKADEKLISPVCSESVESLLQIYGFFLKMQIYSSMNSSRPFIRAGILRSEVAVLFRLVRLEIFGYICAQ